MSSGSGDLERNVRVNFKLSREAAIRLRELALTKRELLCQLGVLAVKLGNESQICVTSGGLECENGWQKRNLEVFVQQRAGRSAVKGKAKRLNTKFGKRSSMNIERRPRSVRPSRVAADTVMISDALPSMSTLNKASFISKRSTKLEKIDGEDRDLGLKSTQSSLGGIVKTIEANISGVKSFANAFKLKGKEGKRESTEVKAVTTANRDSLSANAGTNSKDNSLCNFVMKTSDKNLKNDQYYVTSEIQDDMSTANKESSGKNLIKTQTSCCDLTQETLKQGHQQLQCDSENEENLRKFEKEKKYNGKCDISMESSTLNDHDSLSNITDTFVCNVNNELASFPGHNISYAQHLINLSKQYRLENEKGNEKFFEASKIVKNDHILHSITTGNDKQEDFMCLSGQNSLLFGDHYSTTAVKSAEELSKEHSEASPTNLDSISEASADSLFEEARLGSVDELSWSPSSNENIPMRNSKIYNKPREISPVSVDSKQPERQQYQVKQEKPRKRAKYQRHLKGHSGIICKLCMHPVSKSYSCYKLAHAPKEIRHLFDDGSHCVRVCRRCLPYKSPKRNDKTAQKKKQKTIAKIIN